MVHQVSLELTLMPLEADRAHPYIPNTAPDARAKMFKAIGIENLDDLYDGIPADLRLRQPLNLPSPIPSEFHLRRHVEDILKKNQHCGTYLSFLGAGCYQHFVPAVCDEVANRGEFLTAYGGRQYADHGKYQAIFEFQSLLGELVGMEVVSSPTYDGSAAAASGVLMATRLTGRSKILVPRILKPARLQQIRGFTTATATVEQVDYDPKTGLMYLEDLERKISDDTAAVYVEAVTYLGGIETQVQEIVEIAHRRGALAVVGVDPIALGVLEAPGKYGADIVVGDIQPLGIHMYGGGGLGGFIASRDDERFVSEFPTHLVSIVPTTDGKGFGFNLSTHERTSYEKREAASDFYGTTQWLWGIVAGAYLSLVGPRGLQELGTGIMRRSQYAARRLGEMPALASPLFSAPFFKEFVVDFKGSGKSVAEINRALLERGIFGGRDLTEDFPQMEDRMLVCVTEVHTQKDIDRLVAALQEILS